MTYEEAKASIEDLKAQGEIEDVFSKFCILCLRKENLTLKH